MTQPATTTAGPIRKALPALIVVALAVIAFSRSFDAPFIFDDYHVIPDNPYIRSLWPLSRALTAPNNSTASGRPLVSLTLALNYAFGGLELWHWHAFNLALHVVNILLVLTLIQRLGRAPLIPDRCKPLAPSIGLGVAALWAAHPLNTEAVVYVIQRTELIVSFCYLLTMVAAVRAMESSDKSWRGEKGWTLLAVCACGLGVASKEVIVSAPLMVFLTDRTLYAGGFADALRRRPWLHGGLAAMWLPLAWIIVSAPRDESVGMNLGYSPWHYLLTQAGVINWYLRLCVWPQGLAVFYAWPRVTSLVQAALPGSVILALLACTVWAIVRRHWLGLAGAWFFMILAPTSSFVPIVTEVVAERRMYMPMLSVLSVAVIAAVVLAGGRRAWLGVALAAVLVPLVWVTMKRVEVHRSEELVWREAVERFPQSSGAHANLGAALARVGRDDEAAEHYRIAHELKPTWETPVFNLGNYHQRRSEFDRAIQLYKKSIELLPRFADGYREMGFALLAKGDTQAAIDAFNQALERNPLDARTHVGLGNALAASQQHDKALGQFTRAAEIDPLLFDARHNMAAALGRLGRNADAIAAFRAALKIRPADPNANAGLGALLAETPATADEAADRFARALEGDPTNTDTLERYAILEARRSRFEHAAELFGRLAKARPDDVVAHANAAFALIRLQRFAEALPEMSRAAELEPDNATHWFNLGRIHLSLEDPQSAAPALRKALSIRADFPQASALLQRIETSATAPAASRPSQGTP